MTRIANATNEPEEHEEIEGIEITPEMISAAAEVLLANPFHDFSPGIAESIAEEMLECALATSRGKTAEDAQQSRSSPQDVLLNR